MLNLSLNHEGRHKEHKDFMKISLRFHKIYYLGTTYKVKRGKGVIRLLEVHNSASFYAVPLTIVYIVFRCNDSGDF